MRLLLLLVIILPIGLYAQRKQIPLPQKDPRFTIKAERYFSSLAGTETYYFTVKNNTTDEYRMSIIVTLDLACKGRQTFPIIIGSNQFESKNKVYLPPSHTRVDEEVFSDITNEFKDCRLDDGMHPTSNYRLFTLFKSIDYQITEVENLSKEKAEQGKPVVQASGLSFSPMSLPSNNTNPQTSRKRVSVSQADPRFTIEVERHFSTFTGTEDYFFYVKNNTADEYKMSINVTLELVCIQNERHVFPLRIGSSGDYVFLPPGGLKGYKKTFLSGYDNFKSCRLADGVDKEGNAAFTLFKGISYKITNIENLTQKKAEQGQQGANTSATSGSLGATSTPKTNGTANTNPTSTSSSSSVNGSTASNSANTAQSSAAESSAAQKNKSYEEERAEAERIEREKREAAAEAERIEREKSQAEYDALKETYNQQQADMEAAALEATMLIFYIMGEWIYGDMGKVNPDLVYNNPENLKSLYFNGSIEFGYSASYFPLIFQSDWSTMVNGNRITNESLENRSVFTANFDVNAKFGVEHDFLGGYGFLSSKAGLSPLLDGYQSPFFGYGGRVFAGLRNIKVYGEYMGGSRIFSMTDNDFEENGQGNMNMQFQKLEGGLRLTTNPDAEFVRNHFSLGIVMERLKPANDGLFINPISGNLIKRSISPWIPGVAFQWKKDHNFKLYASYYHYYLLGGDVTNPWLDFESSSTTGNFIELGFIRSIDAWF